MDDLESRVLKVYSSVSPSRTKADDESDWNGLVARRSVALVDRLKLLPEYFCNKSLFDLGIGTGEYAAVYAHWGARVSGLDFNEGSLLRAREFFLKRGGEIADRLGELTASSVTDWEPPFAAYDICTSDGVLHHLSKPQEGLGKLCTALKPGGLLYVSVGTPSGSLQRDLMARIVKERSADLAQAIEIAMHLFPTYMERATVLGHRSAEQVVADNFLVPQDARLPVSWWVKALHAEGVDVFTSWPGLLPEVPEPVTAPPIDLTEQVALEAMDIAASQWSWSRDDCLTELQGFVRGRGINAHASDWPGELQAVVEALSGPLPALKRVLDSCRVFGRGYCGLGDLNLVGRKRI